MIYLALLDNDGSWSRRARLLSNFVKAAVYKQENDTVIWDYDPTDDFLKGVRPDPIWKAQVTVRFMIHAECHGIAFTPSDLQEVARSFLANVIRREGINSSFSSEFQTMQRFENRYGGYKNIVPFILLGKYDAKIEEQITRMVASDPRLGGWLGEPKSSISYAYRLSRAGTSCFSRNSMTPRFEMDKIPVFKRSCLHKDKNNISFAYP